MLASSISSSRFSDWLSGLLSLATAKLPLPVATISPRDSSMRSPSRTDERPT